MISRGSQEVPAGPFSIVGGAVYLYGFVRMNGMDSEKRRRDIRVRAGIASSSGWCRLHHEGDLLVPTHSSPYQYGRRGERVHVALEVPRVVEIELRIGDRAGDSTIRGRQCQTIALHDP